MQCTRGTCELVSTAVTAPAPREGDYRREDTPHDCVRAVLRTSKHRENNCEQPPGAPGRPLASHRTTASAHGTAASHVNLYLSILDNAGAMLKPPMYRTRTSKSSGRAKCPRDSRALWMFTIARQQGAWWTLSTGFAARKPYLLPLKNAPAAGLQACLMMSPCKNTSSTDGVSRAASPGPYEAARVRATVKETGG